MSEIIKLLAYECLQRFEYTKRYLDYYMQTVIDLKFI